MGHTPWQLRQFSDEYLIFVAPVYDDLVLVHQQLPRIWYFRMTDLTCLIWYGFAWPSSRWRLSRSSTLNLTNMWWLPRVRSSKP